LQLEAVAQALRQVAEGKAAAQAEAAEWKRKYELEKAVKAHKHHTVIKGTNWSLYFASCSW
jgi:NAD+ kinase